MNTKAIITFVLVTVGILVGTVALLWKFGNTPKNQVIADVAGEERHVKGQGEIVVTEFSDFQCPACQAVQKPLDEVLAKYDGKVRFVYRHLPLTTIHKNAQMAAQAAEAAHNQNKFWEMHDKLFDTQTIWKDESDPKKIFIQYAKDLGMDADRFATEIESQAVRDAVNLDNLAATRYRLSGTPTFFVNGEQIEFNVLDNKLKELVK